MASSLKPERQSSSSSPMGNAKGRAESGRKYRPPHSTGKCHPSIKKSSSSSQNIVIGAGDRSLSKKFTTQATKSQNMAISNVRTPDVHVEKLINSFNDSLDLNSVADPMSLVASPSRGFDAELMKNSSLSAQDLTNHEFQIKFFDWFIKKLIIYRQAYPDRLILCIPCLLTTEKNSHETDLSQKQKNALSSLSREIKKLREGIVASGRKDWFAILVYEIAAELALEASDFAQLNSLLPHLVFGFYDQITISEHLNSLVLNEGQVLTEAEKLITGLQSTEDALRSRRVIFASVLLLLPLATRVALHEFLDQFKLVSQVFEDTSQAKSTTHSLRNFTNEKHFSSIVKIFKLICRNNWVRLRQTAMPIITQAVKSSQAIIQWDARTLYLDLFYLNSPTTSAHQINDWLKEIGLQRAETGSVKFK
ncbi:hypothetical protein O181_081591 [Austropuccinia psidii MF-1]|uniref:Uncharacterized protein n=1 Tax=Austropuccinia psidii MF-1 TaxID=1389203 RepID=A0A9Q3FKH6_9BASI|nr:hypothetical protein [Austropuccinia psidii MF-1]